MTIIVANELSKRLGITSIGPRARLEDNIRTHLLNYWQHQWY